MHPLPRYPLYRSPSASAQGLSHSALSSWPKGSWPKGLSNGIACAIAIALLLCAWSLRAATLPAGFAETQYGANVGTSPTAMEFALDGRLFVCLQGGDLRVISNGNLLPTPFVTVATSANGERGLLGIAFDPDFANNQFVYVYYTVSTGPIHNRVSRFTANGDVAVVGSETPILDLDNLSTATNHNGGAIHFGPDGKLYVAVGENANPANSQSINTRLGKILRINPDGTIPPDNPTTFPGIAGSPSGVNQAIWVVGLRNPFTFGFQPGTGRLFINDVGESTWEEINDGIAGSNYGWNICEGFCSPPNPTYRDPLFEYGHGSGPTTGCAIVGGAFYNPAINQFPASYSGKYFFDDLCSGWIRLFDPSNNTASGFAIGISSPVDLKVGPEGSLYYLAQGNGGQVWKISFVATPTPSPTPTPLIISGTVSYCSNPDPGPVPNVTVTLTGSASGSTMTDNFGNYLFSSLATGTYTVTPSKPDRLAGSSGIDTVDLIAVQRHFLNLGTPLSGCRLTAADVNGDSAVNTVDVVAIQRFFLGSSTGIANVGKYHFAPVSRLYSPLTTNQPGQNYDTLVFGDVAPGFVH
jgi:glucose/arabinose dehydrogenase